MGRVSTSLVIVIAIASLLGLGWVQYNWLQDSVETNRKVFEQKIDLASGLVSEALKKHHDIHQLISRDLSENSELSQSTDHHFRLFIDSVMYNGSGLEAPFEYGVYVHENDNETSAYLKVAGDNVVPSELDFKECPADQNLNFGWATLSCQLGNCYHNDKPFHFHLGLFFPSNELYLISQMKGTLLAAFVFIMLLTGCFSYTIITIRRQKKLSEMKNDFINNLTHEFKTPIFSIDLATNMLKKAPELSPFKKLKNYTAIIGTENERLKNQVDKVLQMALVDSNNFKLEKKAIDIHSLINKVAENFKIMIRERSGEIILKLNAKKTELFADEIHLKNIIYNLLDNAQKYSPQKPQITISTEDSDEGLMLE
ncbi:MAG: HAMP domain-containing sensor histidine kinase, partial [Ekhidna sp.]